MNQGKITISRVSNNQENPDEIRISLRDATTGKELVEVSMSLEAFALAITRLARVECSYELRGE